ncbi:MAG: nicotinate (nicotinamide) nucleotide adenylyltransferase [bacterium]
MKTGILGGVFSPPHLGHVLPCVYLIEKSIIDNLFVIPCARQPLKEQSSVSFEDRYNMARSAFRHVEGADVLDIESRLPVPSYTINTLKSLKEQYDNELFLIIGSDEAHQIDRWKDYRQIIDYCSIIIIKRTCSDNDYQQAVLKDALRPDNPVYEISSTDIRNRLERGDRTVQYLLPDGVYKYIDEKGLFR